MVRKPNSSCAVCTKRIYRRPLEIATGKIYCSLACCGAGQRIERTCRICSKTYLGTKRTCSRACANVARSGMRYKGKNDLNNAYQGTLLKYNIAVARGGVCEKCSLNNYAILQIHHRKEKSKGGTNDISNLELLCPNCHTTQHLGYSLFSQTKNGRVSRQKQDNQGGVA